MSGMPYMWGYVLVCPYVGGYVQYAPYGGYVLVFPFMGGYGCYAPYGGYAWYVRIRFCKAPCKSRGASGRSDFYRMIRK